MRLKGSVVHADEGLLRGPRAVRDGVDCRAGVVDEVDSFAAVFQSVADFSVVGIDRDGKSRRVAAAEEDEERAGGNDRVGWELEMVLRRRLIAQLPAS